ncbi:TIGR04104 family putative zinc finger protein [Paenisporosarcina sp.]|uniref:TIGR04104 family putative zinc finger protein n=1 Tax=Paenisporosarcina sp. TaxID=1932001 RepID=UPI003C723DDE
MGIQKCEHCTHRFSWRKIYKSNIFLYKPITCSQCGTEHRIRFISRIVASTMVVIPIYLVGFFLASQWEISTGYTILSLVSIGIISTLIIPYMMKYQALK